MMMRGERRQGIGFGVLGLLLIAVPACKESNPDFDGPADTGSQTSTTEGTTLSPDTGMETNPPDTGNQTMEGSGTTTDDPPGTTTTTTATTDGTTTDEPTGSTTEGCTMCGGECVDTQTDPDHCGDCDNKCTPPNQTECVGGMCMPI